jgi:LPXTG-site transpeptidase (sortase) family protein
MPGRPAGGGRLVVPAAVLAAACLVAAVASWVGNRPEAAPGAEVATEGPASVPADRSDTSPPAARVPADRPQPLPGRGRPQRIAVPALDVDVPVVPVTLDGTALDPPPDPQVLGWWAGGARPGAARGSSLLVGHTVHDGGGAMDDLEQVRPGATVRVRTTNGTVAYVVRSVRVIGKAALARQAPRLFSQEVAGRLVLVTCEDWDGTGYLSNVVVTAVPER